MTGILQRRRARTDHRAPICRTRQVDGVAYFKARSAVFKAAKGRPVTDPVLLSRAIDQRLRADGYHVLAPNERPPGWTVEADRIEENLALGELTILRKVS